MNYLDSHINSGRALAPEFTGSILGKVLALPLHGGLSIPIFSKIITKRALTVINLTAL